MRRELTTCLFFFSEYTLIKKFLQEYEKSATVLKIYNVELAKVRYKVHIV